MSTEHPTLEPPALRRHAHNLTPEERQAIQLAFLTEAGVSKLGLSKRFKVDRQTIYRCLKGEDYETLKNEIFAEKKEAALDVFRKNAERVAEKWNGPTIEKAAKKGDHKAMQDFLKVAGVIEETDQPRILVQVGVKLVGGPET